MLPVGYEIVKREWRVAMLNRARHDRRQQLGQWPMPGPNGDYVVTPRKALGDVAQRVDYTG